MYVRKTDGGLYIYLKIKRYTQVQNVLIWMIYIYIDIAKKTCVYVYIYSTIKTN